MELDNVPAGKACVFSRRCRVQSDQPAADVRQPRSTNAKLNIGSSLGFFTQVTIRNNNIHMVRRVK